MRTHAFSYSVKKSWNLLPVCPQHWNSATLHAKSYQKVIRELAERAESLWQRLGEKVMESNENSIMFTQVQESIEELKKMADLQIDTQKNTKKVQWTL